MHEVARAEVSPMRYRVPIFNPGRNLSLSSWLRVVNPGTRGANVVISGLDARGNAAPEGDVRLVLPAGTARGSPRSSSRTAASGLTGRFGRGQGKWQLSVSSDTPLRVMNLMETRSGHLTNLSRGVAPGQRTIPLVLPDSTSGQQGFVRIINRSERAGSVSIEAIDDTGARFGPVVLTMDAKGAVQFNSRDLERGNAGWVSPGAWATAPATGAWSWRRPWTSSLSPTFAPPTAFSPACMTWRGRKAHPCATGCRSSIPEAIDRW